MSVIHTPRQATLDERQLFIPALLAFAIVFFLCRLWYVQVVRSEALTAMGVSTSVDVVERLAPRGRIVDRNGVLLAGVQQNAVVTAVYDTVEKHPEAVEEVARLLGVTPDRLTQPLKKWDPYVPSVVHVGVKPDVASYISEAGDRRLPGFELDSEPKLPGFDIEFQPTRIYVEPLAMSHVLGYVWKPSEREEKRLKEQGIEPQTYVGRAGLEAQYERLLMGKPGAVYMAVDPRMRPLRTVSVDSPVPGEELVLGLDIRLQRLATELLGGRRGAVVASDPRTGEILCMVSSPSFDVHLYDNGISTADFDRLKNDPAQPLFNRAIQGAYQPGSTFKIVTSIAAELAGVFDANRVVVCHGGYKFGNRTWKCLGVHGGITFSEAMTRSCNTYFIDLAIRAGMEKMREAFQMLGIDEKQGIDLGGESKGTLPTEEFFRSWKRQQQRGDILNTGIGQGDVSLTPLQMLNVVSTAANRGRAYRPHLLLGTRQKDGTVKRQSPTAVGQVDLSATFWNQMNAALTNVVDNGTAAGGRIEGVQWAGKTGSAENRRDALTHAWFVGYAPSASPTIAIVVVVEQVGHGGSFAVPIGKDIVERYLKGNLSKVPDVQSTVKPVGGGG